MKSVTIEIMKICYYWDYQNMLLLYWDDRNPSLVFHSNHLYLHTFCYYYRKGRERHQAVHCNSIGLYQAEPIQGPRETFSTFPPPMTPQLQEHRNKFLPPKINAKIYISVSLLGLYRAPCIPFISVYRKRPSVKPGFELLKLVHVH